MILFLSPQGHQLFRVEGYQGPGQFPRTLDVARQVGLQVMAWENALESDPDDVAALLGWAGTSTPRRTSRTPRRS